MDLSWLACTQQGFEIERTAESHRVVELFQEGIELPEADNTSEGFKTLRAANERFRQIP